MKKTDVLALLENLPDEFDTEELMYQLYVWEEIEEGERDLQEGRVISHEEVLRIVQSWRS
jgi:predicted transcriptional regulator